MSLPGAFPARAFDHGQSHIAPLNLLLVAANVYVWWGRAPAWVVAPLALLAIALTGDHHAGMFLAPTGLFVLLAIGLAVWIW